MKIKIPSQVLGPFHIKQKRKQKRSKKKRQTSKKCILSGGCKWASTTGTSSSKLILTNNWDFLCFPTVGTLGLTAKAAALRAVSLPGNSVLEVAATIEFFANKTKLQYCQCWHQRLYYMKTKNSHNKILPLVKTEPGISDSKSNTLLSELTWHLFVSLRL